MIGAIDEAQVRRDFAVTRKTVYMNNGAIAPTPLSTIKAMTDFMLKLSEEGPDASQTADHVTSLLAELRTRVAHLINCHRDEVVLTQSTTQGINMVAGGLRWNKGDAVVVRGGRQEHYSNYLPWLAASQKRGLVMRELAADESGLFDLGELEKAARGTRLVAMSHVLYNTGAIMPLGEVGRIARENNALFCVDAAQSAGSVPVDVRKMGCQFMAFPGFKWLCGPTGIGIFYCSKDAADMLEPTTIGIESATISEHNVIANFDMPARLQAGFRNYPGAAGLESSLRYILRIGLLNIRRRNMQVARVLREEIGKIPGVKIYGPEEESMRSPIVTFQPPPAVEPADLVKRLEKDGIVLAARQVGGKKAVRAAPHFFNNEQEASIVASYVKSLIG
ncbi:MAG: aminotransferase class V-fold PLP-dependent enzyme [Nitrososphaera sp.]|nr:aminotransferase class V-fold PLP-dependent enzyme [Nitrososphaera sp.]